MCIRLIFNSYLILTILSNSISILKNIDPDAHDSFTFGIITAESTHYLHRNLGPGATLDGS